ncbi:unnamed protein product [Effrenium voratum]|nr:unnamed protein product [Effrenium voratum]
MAMGLSRWPRAAKGHSLQWVQRAAKDPWIQRAHEKMYRSRAAFKLKQIDAKFSIFSRKGVIIDLGCNPGSWSQIALEKTGRHAVVLGVAPWSCNTASCDHTASGIWRATTRV